jgi:hypothetical protein
VTDLGAQEFATDIDFDFITRPHWVRPPPGSSWFIDPTPWGSSEFVTPGKQSEISRMDLLTVLEHALSW